MDYFVEQYGVADRFRRTDDYSQIDKNDKCNSRGCDRQTLAQEKTAWAFWARSMALMFIRFFFPQYLERTHDTECRMKMYSTACVRSISIWAEIDSMHKFKNNTT